MIWRKVYIYIYIFSLCLDRKQKVPSTEILVKEINAEM